VKRNQSAGMVDMDHLRGQPARSHGKRLIPGCAAGPPAIGGLRLSARPRRAAAEPYAEAVQTGAKFTGRVGVELDVEAGRKAARLAALNVLAVTRQPLGSPDEMTRIVPRGVSVATSAPRSSWK
jgi:hypothetical protein